jgi:hypothetical protein
MVELLVLGDVGIEGLFENNFRLLKLIFVVLVNRPRKKTNLTKKLLYNKDVVLEAVFWIPYI